MMIYLKIHIKNLQDFHPEGCGHFFWITDQLILF